jgi:predicted nuclease of predicted toxin-antitoxin system
MRFLLDENLSPKVSEPLRAAGRDVTIAREVGLRTATDQVVIQTARREARVVVSADTDFGAILALSGAATPSFVVVRRPRTAGKMSRQHSSRTTSRPPSLTSPAGAIVVLGETTLRIHRMTIDEEAHPEPSPTVTPPTAGDSRQLPGNRPGCGDEGEQPSTENNQAQQVKLD